MRRWAPFSLPFIGTLALCALLTAPDALDAKRNTRSPGSFHIVNVTLSPVPFTPGPESSLALDVTVALPLKLDGIDVIEVSALISFPSRRSIRFVVDRQPLDNVVKENGTLHKRLTLHWDGKDQYRQYVSPGTYAYAVRAKLMAREQDVARAKNVSPFEKGTLVVLSSPDVVK